MNLYDVPYIARRISRVLGDKWMKSLSPWNRANEREVYVQGRKNYAYDISGVNILDYLDLYKKFTYTNQESYRLDHIAFVELGQRKVDHSEYENFKDFYTRDWQKFMEYNIQDVELIDRLEDKMKLLELAITMSYDAKVNFEDVYSQVRMWDTMIYNYLTDRDVVVPPKRVPKRMKNTQEHTSRNRFLESMIGLLVLTLIVCILILLCSTISRQRPLSRKDIPQQRLIEYLESR